MAFIFSTSHLPETRLSRPEDDEEEDVLQPMPHAGAVRAFSHLPEPRPLADTSGPLSTRPAIPVGRTRPYVDPEAGAGTDEDRGTDHAPGPDSDHDYDDAPRAHDAYANDAPWHSPRITAQDLPQQSHGEDEDAPDPRSARDAGFDDTSPAGRSASRYPDTGSFHRPQDIRSDFHSPSAPDSSAWGMPAAQNRADLARGLPFETRGVQGVLMMQQKQGKGVGDPSSLPGPQASQRAIAAPLQQQTRGSAPQALAGRPAAQPQALAQAQNPAANPAQNAPAAAESPAGGSGGNQAPQHPYKIHEADENAEIVRTASASAPPARNGVKFGEHVRSVINEALENSPTARDVLNKARELSGKDVVIHTTTDDNAHQQIGLDGTIHIYVNPNTLLPGTIAHETAHAIQNWYQQAASRKKRGTAPPTDQELDATLLQGRQELHGIAPVTYIDPRRNPEDDTSNHEPRSKSTENEAMRIANIVNAEISAAKVKAKMEAFKKSNPDKFNEMLKNPEEFAQSVAQSFWFEQEKLEAISHQSNKHIPMRESTLYGKDGGLKHVLEMLGYGVTAGHIKNAAPIRHRYAPPQ